MLHFSYSHHHQQETAKQGNALSLPSAVASRSTTSVSSERPASPNTSSFRLNPIQRLGVAQSTPSVKANRFSDVLSARNNRPRTLSVEQESRPSTSSRRTDHGREKDSGDATSSFNLGASYPAFMLFQVGGGSQSAYFIIFLLKAMFPSDDTLKMQIHLPKLLSIELSRLSPWNWNRSSKRARTPLDESSEGAY